MLLLAASLSFCRVDGRDDLGNLCVVSVSLGNLLFLLAASLSCCRGDGRDGLGNLCVVSLGNLGIASRPFALKASLRSTAYHHLWMAQRSSELRAELLFATSEDFSGRKEVLFKVGRKFASSSS